MESLITHQAIFEIELDVLHFLQESDKPVRFSEVLRWLLSLNKYKNPKVAKTNLAKVLKKLCLEEIVKKNKKSHKNVQYSIKNEKKAKLYLTFRKHEIETASKMSQEILLRGHSIQQRNNDFVAGMAITLMIYEKALFETKKDYDKSMFLYLAKSAKEQICTHWDLMVEYIDNVTLEDPQNAATNDYYEQKLKTQKIVIPEGFKDNYHNRQILEHHYADLQMLNCEKEIYEWCLNRTSKLLELGKKQSDMEYLTQILNILNQLRNPVAGEQNKDKCLS